MDARKEDRIGSEMMRKQGDYKRERKKEKTRGLRKGSKEEVREERKSRLTGRGSGFRP